MDQSVQTCKFWAFISYSHYDKKHARRLMQSLERLRVPSAHRAAVEGAPARFAPVFIDEDENAAHPRLSEELQNALRRSRKLIVVCSPFAANSPHVADEIRYFRELGRQGDILCLIVSGVPNASDDGKAYLECFPAPLRFEDRGNTRPIAAGDRPLAASIGEGSDAEWKNALDQTVAGLLDITLGDLKRSQSNARHKRYAALGALALLAVGAAWSAAWALFLPHTSYAKNYLRRAGAWEAVDPISPAEAGRRGQSYQFHRRGAFGPLLEVRSVNPYGACEPGYLRSMTDDEFSFTCTNARACAARFSPQGVRSEEIIDQYGNPIETVMYQASPAPAQEGEATSDTYGVVTSAVVGCSRKQGSVNFVRIARIKGGPLDGLDRRVLFFKRESDQRRPQPNANYAYGIAFDYDNAGRLKEKTFLSESGHPMVSKLRYGVEQIAYTDTGELASRSFHLPDRTPAGGPDGVALVKYHVSRAGDVVEEHYFGADGQPTFNANGIYGARTVYRSGAHTRRIDYLGSAHALLANRHGVASTVDTFDDAGFRTGTSAYGVDGKPVVDGDTGCFRIAFTVDAVGAMEGRRCLDRAGKPALSFAGVHATRYVLDRKGNVLSTSYWLTDGKQPAYCRDYPDHEDGCPFHRSDNAFDENGNRTRVRFFDESGALTVSGQLMAGWDVQYSMDNFELRTMHIGVDGLPAFVPGYRRAGSEFTYNLFGQVVAETGLDKAGRPTERDHAQYDAYGNIIRLELQDLAGKPRRDSNGVAGYTQQFDERGRMVRRMYFGPDGRPERSGNVEYGFVHEFDRFGRVVRRTSVDASGAPALGSEDFSSMRHDFSPPGVERIRYVDLQGRLAGGSDGIAIQERRMSPRGDILEQRNFGVSGEPITIPGRGFFGYNKVYDAQWNQVDMVTRDVAWKPVGDASDDGIAITRWRYDVRGRATWESHFDKDGKPLSSEERSFATAYEYDRWGRVGVERFLAPDGKTLDSRTNIARSVSSYDDRGRKAQERYYDAQGNPAEARQAAMVRFAYDEFDREAGRSFFDKTGQPILSPISGRAEVRYLYNVYGQQTEERSLGLRGEPINRKDTGWYRKVSRYDERGRKQADRCYTVAGAVVAKCED